MKKSYTLSLLLLLTHLTFGQKAPLPPKPPKPPKQEKNSEKNDSFSFRMYGEPVKRILPKFEIPLSSSTNTESIYYFKTIENKLVQLDSTITAEQIISITKFNSFNTITDPKLLDSLANKAYKLNDEKNYTEAIKTAQLILDKCPNNITGHKEISLAYRRIGNDNLADKHFGMMTKIISSVFKYSDGTYDSPFLINNFFEGISIYEAAFRCKPNKATLIADKQGRLLGAYNGYSSSMDEILIRYADLTHWKSRLKKGDYIEEQ